jgi:hypothetical protein
VDGRHASSTLNARSCRGEDCDSDTIWDKERGLVKIMNSKIIRVKKPVKLNGRILSKW